MKKIKELLRKFRTSNQGLSLIELICAVAVFSILVTGIASSVLVSTRVYSKSTTDVMMQQSAQVLTNYLTNLIVDANDVTWEDNKLTVTDTNGDDIILEYNPTLGRLTLIQSNKGTGVLSDNLTSFSVINNFENNQSVNFAFTIETSNVGFDSSFTATSRNGYVEQEGSVIIALDEPVIILEPGQEYAVGYSVIATPGVNSKLVDQNSGWLPIDPTKTGTDDSYYQITSSQILIRVGSAESIEKFDLNLETEYLDPETSLPFDSKTLLVKVRRINNIGFSSGSTTGSGDVGELYSLTAKFSSNSVYNGPFESLYDTTADYYSPYLVSWYGISMTDKYGNVIDGSSYFSYTTSIITDDGVYSNMTEAASHINERTVYKYTLKVVREIDYGTTVTVTVRGDHSFGSASDGVNYNRTDSSYYEPSGSSKVVYASTQIYIRYPVEPDSDFHRGDEYTNLLSYMGTNYPTTNYGGITDHFFARVRNKTTNSGWTSWIITGEQSNATGKIQASESMRYFAPNDDYEFEYVRVVYDIANKKVLYPNYYALFQAGSPFYGYTYSGTSDFETIYSCGCRWNMPPMKLNVYNTTSSGSNTISFKGDMVTAFFVNNNLKAKCYLASNNKFIRERQCQNANPVRPNPAAPNKYYYTTTFELDNFNNDVNNNQLTRGLTYNVIFGVTSYYLYDNVPTSLNQSEWITATNMPSSLMTINGSDFIPIEHVSCYNSLTAADPTGNNYAVFTY
ncbi:MAG: prepilin-type N-terminal cleavage/methylation domain-containing protein [Lachnospiraceae bacterium]|nr:prepilin-type N-terminal cleavage/methylation domain-containing protein [Lachnospiraceae bacterium]